MERSEFWKRSGSGNDFILIDNRDGRIADEAMGPLVKRVCRRRESVGADGVIFVTQSGAFDFAWRFFNADGGEAEMCGNGGRCVAPFAYLKGIAGPSLKFETLAGILSAQVDGKRVKLEMTKPFGLKLDETLLIDGKKQIFSSINTGVPHAVLFVEDVEGLDIVQIGRALRYHSHFSPSGTNANFIRLETGSKLSIRTYERGVEEETLACGTGAVAAAL